jgi:hypothetical protein
MLVKVGTGGEMAFGPVGAGAVWCGESCPGDRQESLEGSHTRDPWVAHVPYR